MKNFSILVILLLKGASLLFGQFQDNSRRDLKWPLGYDYFRDSVGIDAITFDFSGISIGDTMKISYRQQAFEMNKVNASICDQTGNLEIYTNGCVFGNENRDQILEFDTINFTNAHHIACFQNIGLGGSRQSIIIPDNYNISIFHLLSEPLSVFTFGVRSDILMYNKIQIIGNDFILITKDLAIKKIWQDSFFNVSHLSACLHGNGKDWWVITSLINEKSYQKILISENQIIGPIVQKIGSKFDVSDGATGNLAVCDPDGADRRTWGMIQWALEGRGGSA